MINFDKGFDTTEIRARQDQAQREIDRFLAMAGRATVQEWNFAEMCMEVDVEWAYRMLYRDLSEYTHASYGTSSSAEENNDSVIAKYLALLAPMDLASLADAKPPESSRG